MYYNLLKTMTKMQIFHN